MKLGGFMIRVSTSKKAKIVVVAAAALLSVGLWVLIDRVSSRNDGSTVLMTLTHTGGMCQEGPCPPVSRNIYADGRFDGNARLPAERLAALKEIIGRTDFTSYSKKSDPMCSSFVDGRDLNLSFPQKHGDARFTPCLLSVPKDDRGIRAIVKLLDEHNGS